MVSDLYVSNQRGLIWRLNPCSNGIWSLTSALADAATKATDVLILVLMEYGL